MLLSMDSSVSALSQFQQALNVTANNIANVDTTGFKAATVSFEDAFRQTVGTDSVAGSMQVGTGVSTASIANQFTQGSITSSSNPNAMAIDSTNGFFLVRDPSTGSEYVTRDGDFQVSTDGYLETSNGMHVQGYTDATLKTVGDIQITNPGVTASDGTEDTTAVATHSFGSDGMLTITTAKGTTFTGGQILLQNFTSPQQLVSVGNNLYSGLSAAGKLDKPEAPGTNGLGKIDTGKLEMSNVDLANELTTLITTQRAYEANSKVITTSDEILQSLINLKR